MSPQRVNRVRRVGRVRGVGESNPIWPIKYAETYKTHIHVNDISVCIIMITDMNTRLKEF